MTEIEYIERKALLNKLSEIPALKNNPNLMVLCKEWANSVPTADVRENIKSEWGSRSCYCRMPELREFVPRIFAYGKFLSELRGGDERYKK